MSLINDVMYPCERDQQLSSSLPTHFNIPQKLYVYMQTQVLLVLPVFILSSLLIIAIII